MKIHFKLKSIDEIQHDLSFLENYQVSWLDLTDGDLWLEINGHKIYIYSEEAKRYYQLENNYVDYQMSIFVFYFSYLFEPVSKSLSDDLYHLFDSAEDTEQFSNMMRAWFDCYYDKGGEIYKAFLPDYEKLSGLCYDRMMSDFPPTQSPILYFFRNKEKIKIIWDTDIKVENNIRLWKAKSASYEMEYADFKKEIKIFYHKFIDEMRVQINNALDADWGHLTIDKALPEYYYANKEELYNTLSLLDKNTEEDNEYIENMYAKMRNELANMT